MGSAALALTVARKVRMAARFEDDLLAFLKVGFWVMVLLRLG
jgi:hypothetical protein